MYKTTKFFDLICGCSAMLVSIIVCTSAMASTPVLPDNAHEARYGEGWECNLGFREVENRCEAIDVPEHAFPTGSKYGAEWDCKRGFEKSDNNCLKIEVPVNGYLNSYGNKWQCEHGYRSDNSKNCTPPLQTHVASLVE